MKKILKIEYWKRLYVLWIFNINPYCGGEYLGSLYQNFFRTQNANMDLSSINLVSAFKQVPGLSNQGNITQNLNLLF